MRRFRSDRSRGYATLFIISVFLWFSSFVLAYLTIIRNDYQILDNLVVISDDTRMIKEMVGKFECLYYQDAITDFFIDDRLVRVTKIDEQNYILQNGQLSLKLFFKDNRLFDYEIEP